MNSSNKTNVLGLIGFILLLSVISIMKQGIWTSSTEANGQLTSIIESLYTMKSDLASIKTEIEKSKDREKEKIMVVQPPTSIGTVAKVDGPYLRSVGAALDLLDVEPNSCKQTMKVGGNPVFNNGEGSWTMCNKLKPNCSVFSFGIANDFSFDDQLVEKGCRVWSFDPSMYNYPDGPRGPGKSVFYKIGLGKEQNDNFVGIGMGHSTAGNWKLNTVSNLMKIYNVNHLDVLKFDVEYAEWDAIENLLSSGVLEHVDQVLFEVHFWKRGKDFRKIYKLLQGLKDLGFRSFSVHENPMSTREMPTFFHIACCYEVSMIK